MHLEKTGGIKYGKYKDFSVINDSLKSNTQKKNFTVESRAKHCIQETIVQLLYLENFIVWLRDLDTKKIGA